ncbi:hypothetical protein BDP27DRAFT_1424184 [Rhodocollybia butyracea]|uniref:Uncharacterized protein n=1 Tax=Rhodocollybia butyracea TaxID=206335 RepID=A0A9P5PQC5_9AGAR|nr:hypothetical protein BDP27DRAFT_1424184 [Rhodocollybia butyracea]
MNIQLPYQKKRGRPSKAPVAEVVSSEVNDNSDEHPAPIPKKRGRPSKAPERELSEPLPMAVSLYTKVEMPKILQHGKTAKGTKLITQPNVVDSPRTLDLDMNWGGFIDITCATVKCTRDQLVLSSLRWGWTTLKGASKQRSPITTASGYEQMIKSIKNMYDKERNSGMVYIYMAIPKQLEEKSHSRPWNHERERIPATGSTESELTVNLESLIGQKKAIDARLQPITDDIRHPARGHFDLDDNRVKVFALAVYKKEVSADLTEIPLTSNHFKQNQTIGYYRSQRGRENVSHDPRPSNTPSTAPTVPTPQVLPPPALTGTPYAYGYPLPPPGPFHPHYYPYTPPPPLPPGFAPPATYEATSSWRRASPPVEPCDLKKWCERMGLDEMIYDGLVKLHFQVGDSLNGIRKSRFCLGDPRVA